MPMPHSIVQLALLVLLCIAASHAQDVENLPWCMNAPTKEYELIGLRSRYGSCNLEDETDDHTGVVSFEGSHKLRQDSPCFKDFKHVACEKYPAKPMFDPDTGEDICMLVSNDGDLWPVEIKLKRNSYDHLVVYAELRGHVSCDQPYTGILVLRAENTNALDFFKVIARFANGTEEAIFVAEGDHFEEVQELLPRMQPIAFVQKVVQYFQDRPQAVYNSLMEYKIQNPEKPVNVIWLLKPGTVLNTKMLSRVAALLKLGVESAKAWFDAPCTLGDYLTKSMCQAHRQLLWRAKPQLTIERCPKDQKKIIEDLFASFSQMNLLLQKASNWFAKCDHHALDSTLCKKEIQDIGCDKFFPPRSQDEKESSVDCKMKQLKYYYLLVCACTFVFAAIVVAILVCVSKKYPYLLDKQMVEQSAQNAMHAATRSAKDRL